MRILLLHNYYQQSGGEDAVVAAEQDLLTANGNKVRLFAVTNDTIKGLSAKFKVAYETTYSNRSQLEIIREIAEFKPNIVHVHNFFPLLTPSVYDACRNAAIPVVQTLHNYRTICPGALLMRDGKICEECLNNSPYRAVLHRCYRESLLGSLSVARMVDYHRKQKTWQNKIDCLIALTEFAKSKFVAAGFSPEKIAVKPNFVKTVTLPVHQQRRSGALFVGRLSKEKGIITLLEAWRALALPLRLVGDGPMTNEVEGYGNKSITYLGRFTAAEIAAEMERAALLIMPSKCYETFGMVIIEAFSRGLPVIASRLGSMAELVNDGVTGLHFEAGNAEDLAAKARWAAEHPDEMRVMGVNARQEYEQKYTAEANYRQLMTVYEEVIKSKKNGGNTN